MLPGTEEREALLAALAELISEYGARDFLFAPVLTPTPEHFPDEWRPDLDGASAMLRRLLSWSSLGDVPFTMHAYDSEQSVEVKAPGGDVWTRPLHGVAAWFAGQQAGQVLFGVEVRLLDRPETLAGVLAHEVAHAWRFRNGAWDDDGAHDEELTDVTTVYLGAGLLSCNNADRFRTSGEVRGGMATFEWRHESMGYLSGGALAFLLAAQLAARRDPAHAARIEGLLERNQRADFRAAYDELARDVAALDAKLRLPPLEARVAPAPRAVPPRFELPPPRPKEPPPEPEVLGVRVLNTWQWRAMFFGFAGLIAGLVGGVVASAAWPMLAVPGGVALAFFFRFRVCSQCEHKVAETDERCASCGVKLVASVDTLRDRHDAEVAWHRQQVDPKSREFLGDDHELEREALESSHRED